MTGTANSSAGPEQARAGGRRLFGRTPSSLARGLSSQVLGRSGRRHVVSLVTAPPAAARALLRAPAAARRHPLALEVQALQRQGWAVDHVWLSTTPVRACVRLRSGGEVREIADNDPAFAAFAATLLTRRGSRPGDAAGQVDTQAAGLRAAPRSADR